MLSAHDTERFVELRREQLLREKRRRLAALPLMEFIPAVTPGYDPPYHLAPMVSLFELAETRGGVRAWTSIPPQHGKSETIFHLFVRRLLRDPRSRNGYATYSIDFAKDQARIAARIAERARLPLAVMTSDQWITPEGGGIIWTGTGGRLTGKPIDGIMVVDDPIKGRLEAESPAYRRAAIDFITGTVLTRLHPGASVIINQTRWHEEDPIGVFKTTRGWPGVNLPAIKPDGTALWPERRPLEWLEQQRKDIDEYEWWSLYMGEPRKRGDRVFRDVYDYTELPPGPARRAVGFDAAYTAKSHADYTVVLFGRLIDGRIYLTNMLRWREDAGVVVRQLRAMGVRRMAWRRSGTEKGLEAFLASEGIIIDAIPATQDKYAAAGPAAAAWNAGEILVPSEESSFYGPWVRDLVAEVTAFTGMGDRHDDVVDALVALHHRLTQTPKVGMRSYV